MSTRSMARAERDDAALATQIGECRPGLTLLRLLRGAGDPQHCSPALRVALAVGWERLQGWCVAEQAPAIVALRDGFGEELETDPLAASYLRAEELASAELDLPLRLGRRSADDRVSTAIAWATRLQATHKALRSGDISLAQARILVRKIDHLDPAVRDEVQRRVLEAAPKQTCGQLGKAIDRTILAVAPTVAQEQYDEDVRKRAVNIWEHSPGISTVAATMPTAYAHALFAELSRRAEASKAAAGPEDTRSMDARRCDALMFAMLPTMRGLDGERIPPIPQGMLGEVVSQVRITMDWQTALGLADNPAMLEGHGPIPAQLAREIAEGGEWRRWLLEPVTGALLDEGSEVYRPRKKLRQFINDRDQCCRFPGCGRRAEHCDAEHAIPFNRSGRRLQKRGGRTNRLNLRPMCRYHHRLKTHGGWKVEALDHGGVQWTSPLGRTYVLPPHDHRSGGDDVPDDADDE